MGHINKFMRAVAALKAPKMAHRLEVSDAMTIDIASETMTLQMLMNKKVETTIDNVAVLQSRVDSLTEQMSRGMETLQQIQQQMNEEKKEDENGLQQQIDELTVSVHKLMTNDNKAEDSERGAFKNWVLYVLKLPEYLDLFEKNGVASLKDATTLSVSRLSMMGIKTIGHKMKILSAVAALEQTNTESVACPGIANGRRSHSLFVKPL